MMFACLLNLTKANLIWSNLSLPYLSNLNMNFGFLCQIYCLNPSTDVMLALLAVWRGPKFWMMFACPLSLSSIHVKKWGEKTFWLVIFLLLSDFSSLFFILNKLLCISNYWPTFLRNFNAKVNLCFWGTVRLKEIFGPTRQRQVSWNLKCYLSLKMLIHSDEIFRSFYKFKTGSVGQKAAKLLAVKVGSILKKNSATSAITAKMRASACGLSSTLTGSKLFSKFDGRQLWKI